MAMKTTKQLARELGLLRKRKVCGTSPNGKKKSKIEQMFSYLIVLDFESTCWENDKTLPQEIIEFPAVLLNCSSGQIESTFHHYVQPSEQPGLSEFCCKLTGISQGQVDTGIPLSICLRKFFYWLKKLQTDKGIVCVSDKHLSNPDNDQATKTKLAAFLTWSDWDLGVCLLNETKRKQIMKPSALDRWIDLRAVYRNFYSRRPDGLNGAMKDLGLQFDGREHSGIDDAKNTARLAHRLMCDGCLFQITKTLKTNFSSTSEKAKNTCINQCPAVNVKLDKHSLTSKSSTPLSSKTGHVLSFIIKTDEQVSDKAKGGSSTPKGKGLSVRSTNVPLVCLPSSKTTKTSSATTVEHNLTPSRVNRTLYSESSGSQARKAIPLPAVSPSSAAVVVKSPSSKKSGGLNKTAPSINLLSSSSHIISSSSSKSHQASPKSFHSCPTMISSSSTPISSHSSTTRWSSSSSFSSKTPQNPPSHHTKKSTTIRKPPSSSPLLSAPFKSPVTFHSYQSPQTNSVVSTTSSSFKTPFQPVRPSVMKATPPLCSCGRRSRRRLVQNPGPNEGRWFFSCTTSGRSYGGGNSHSGCGFFQWELCAR